FYVDDVQRILNGTWTSRAYWEGYSKGMVTLDALSANAAAGTAEAIEAAKAKIIDGSFEPFTGPIADQKGTVRVADGVKITDDEIWNMGWFVKGVIGNVPN
ncbi:MAG TPA: hypothetical protein PKH81_03390, partial [Treponemataceae bacterium]|nr:hypothetical protein [Treponemataceae bacterium]